MATLLARTQKLPRLLDPRTQWRAKRATPRQGKLAARGNLCVGARIVAATPAWVQGVGSTSEHDKKNEKTNLCVRPQTDFIRLVSSKLVLRGAPRPPGRPF